MRFIGEDLATRIVCDVWPTLRDLVGPKEEKT